MQFSSRTTRGIRSKRFHCLAEILTCQVLARGRNVPKVYHVVVRAEGANFTHAKVEVLPAIQSLDKHRHVAVKRWGKRNQTNPNYKDQRMSL